MFFFSSSLLLSRRIANKIRSALSHNLCVVVFSVVVSGKCREVRARGCIAAKHNIGEKKIDGDGVLPAAVL